MKVKEIIMKEKEKDKEKEKKKKEKKNTIQHIVHPK